MEDKLITIARYSFSRAEIVKSRLESEGIECQISSINLLQPHIGSGVKVAVMQKDIEKALKILIEIEKIYEQENQEEQTDNIVTVGAYSYTRAQIIKTKLELEKIECFLKNVNMIQANVGSGVKVRIHESDVEKALPIIIQVSKDYEDTNNVEESHEQLKEIDKILVPIDFSEFSAKAAKYAIKIAEKYKAEIHLFHAYYNPAIYAEPFTEGYAYHLNVHKYIRDLESEANKNLENFAKNMQKTLDEQNIEGVNIDTTLVCGAVDTEIANMSKIYKPDLIIIGMKGEGDGFSESIGTHTFKIIRGVKVPVLVIPEETKHKEISEIEQIMYATDLDKSDFISIRKLIGIIGKINPKIYCVHISTRKNDGWSKVKLDKLNEHIHKRYPQYNVDCLQIENEDKIKGVEAFIKEKNISLMAINSHKRSILTRLFNPSITKRMIYQTEIPLLVFHA